MIKVNTCVGWFVGEDKDIDIVEGFVGMGINVQLSFYKREHAEKYMWNPRLLDCREHINVIHLPNGLTTKDYESDRMVGVLCKIYEVDLFVVHPWATEDLADIAYLAKEGGFTVCFETFNKGKSSPFRLLAQFGDEFTEDHLGLCLDFSHLPVDLVTASFITGLIPYTKMWHVSNKKGKDQHLPVFVQDADTNVHRVMSSVLTVPDFPVREIVLEYMREYEAKLVKNYWWLNTYVVNKRRKHGNL